MLVNCLHILYGRVFNFLFLLRFLASRPFFVFPVYRENGSRVASDHITSIQWNWFETENDTKQNELEQEKKVEEKIIWYGKQTHIHTVWI